MECGSPAPDLAAWWCSAVVPGLSAVAARIRVIHVHGHLSVTR